MKILIFISSILFALQPGSESNETHPVYMSVTEMVYDAKQKRMEMICKLFTNDLESVLKKYHNGVDLLNPSKKQTSLRWIEEYVQRNLEVKISGKTVNFECVGYEREGDAILVYYQSAPMAIPREIIIQNSLLYDDKTEQMNIMHVELNGKRISRKLTHPDKVVKFEF